MNTQDVRIDKIRILENVRTRVHKEHLESLMESIKQHGLKQAIGVGETKANEYVLIFGFRRLEACKKLGWKTIPAVVEEEPSFSDLLIINAVENIQRKDVTPEELGRIVLKLEELGLSMSEIAIRLNIGKDTASEAASIYKRVPSDLRKKVVYMSKGKRQAGKISATAMSQLLAVRKEFGLSNDMLRKMTNVATKEDLNVREISIIAKLISGGHTVASALRERSKYKILYVSCLVDNKVLDDLSKKHDVSSSEILRKIVYGEIKPLSRIVVE